jgi:hypothetical protein
MSGFSSIGPFESGRDVMVVVQLVPTFQPILRVYYRYDDAGYKSNLFPSESLARTVIIVGELESNNESIRHQEMSAVGHCHVCDAQYLHDGAAASSLSY